MVDEDPRCLTPHPDNPALLCLTEKGNHERHFYPDGSSVPNPDYRPYVPPAENRARLKDYARLGRQQVQQERVGPCVDPSDNAVGRLHWDPHDTESLAAHSVAPRSGTQRAAVLRAIAESTDGLTDDEAAVAAEIGRMSAVPRRNELMAGGWVEDSGRRRPTPHGGISIVWVVTERGRSWSEGISA